MIQAVLNYFLLGMVKRQQFDIKGDYMLSVGA